MDLHELPSARMPRPADEHDFDDERDDEPEGASSLYVLPAARAPIAAVFLRVPGRWWHVMKWDLSAGDLEPGAWLKGTLYPRRSDLSSDGRLLLYFLAKEGKGDFMGMRERHTFTALSRLPWVHALAAWPEDGTDTDGHHFVAPPRWDLGAPQHGSLRSDAGGIPERFGTMRTEPAQYAAELRRGWVEHPSCPPRERGDVWDEERSVVLVRERPSDPSIRLVLRDEGWDPDAPGAIDGRAPTYSLETADGVRALDDVVWADWHPAGLLMVATEGSRLEVRDPALPATSPLWSRDLSNLTPKPRPSPDWAQRA